MHQPLFRSFSDPTGRPWRVSEAFSIPFARDRVTDPADPHASTPLLFISGIERRWLSEAPVQWCDVAEEQLMRLLAEAKQLPHRVASFAGLVDE